MTGAAVQVAHRDYIQIACTPDGYTNSVAPPKHWEKVINGKKVSPKIIQKVFLNCQAAKLDLAYIAQCLGVGDSAMMKFLENEKTIPETIAHRFVEFFSSNHKIPKASAAQIAAQTPKPWATDQEEVQRRTINRVVVHTQDFDTEALAGALFAERKRRKLKALSVARAIHSTPENITRAESGQITYQRDNNSIIFRLCKFYKIDVRNYELKPRVNYRLFQSTIKRKKKELRLNWEKVAELAGISESLAAGFGNKKRSNVVIYLTKEMEAVLNALNIDKNEVLEKRA